MNRIQVRGKYLHFSVTEQIEPSRLVLSTGAAMVMHGLREETQDLDLELPFEDFNELKETHLNCEIMVVPSPIYGQPFDGLSKGLVMQYQSDITLIPLPSGVATEEIDGVWVYTKPWLLRQKLIFNRPKDQADILALQRCFMD